MTLSFPKSRFLINPLVAKSFWTPEPYQMVHWHNPSRLNSFWLGTIAQVVMLPGRLWHEFFLLMFMGHLRAAAWFGLWCLPVSTFAWFVLGVRGRLFAIDLPIGIIANSEVMTEEVALQFMCLGVDEVVVDLQNKTALTLA